MEVGKVCDCCHRPAGKVYTCFKCGKRVCKRCYTHEGLCLECAGKKPQHTQLVVPDAAKPTRVDESQIKK